MAADLLTPAEWSRRYGIVILDPDGWRGDDGRPFADPIDREEFEERMESSTIGPASHDTRRTEDNWALGISDAGEAPCGCRATASPSEFAGAVVGRGWYIQIYACEEHAEHTVDATFEVSRRMTRSHPDATLSALLASVLEEIGKR